MSESTFPFAEGTEDVSGGGDRTKLFVVLGALVALVAVVFLVVLPRLGGDAESPAVPVQRAAKTKTAAKAPAVAAKPAAKAPVTTFKDTVSRDPFRPLYVAPKEVVGTGAVAPGAVAPAPAYPAAPAAPASSTQIGSNRVALVDVFVRDGKTFAQTKVNETVHTPAVGGDFASNYRLLGASGTCATYLFGDEQFRLCEGQEVLK